MKKIKVAVLAGGPSTEYEVSINSGKNVFREIDRKKFEPSWAVLSKHSELKINGKKARFPEDLAGYDIVFNAMHGQFGEDGQVQAIFERVGIPFTGSGSVASSLAMDKWASFGIFKKAGLRVAPSQLLASSKTKLGKNLGWPVVLKPRNGGSSVGVEIVKSEKDLEKAVRRVFKFDSEVVAESFVAGREFTCGVLEINGKLKALPVVEIRPKPKYKFFDYEAKYKTGATDEIVPAEIDTKLASEIQSASLKAHRALKASVYSRSDFMWDGKKLFILELNTLPGMTKISLLPKAARAAKISFPKLIEIIIQSSLRK
ncbi:MAG: D-alanine--D-alanine ligase [Patescibacteria group bacterium]